MFLTDEAVAQLDKSDVGGWQVREIFGLTLTAGYLAARDGRDYVLPEDVDRAIELCWK